MQFKNKKNGKVTESIESFTRTEDGRIMLVCVINLMREIFFYNSLAEFNEEWEDFKDPAAYWHIAELCAGVQQKVWFDDSEDRFNKEIGNYFGTKEKAEEAVEKLMAWERLRKNLIDHSSEYGLNEATEDVNANVSFKIKSYPSVGEDE